MDGRMSSSVKKFVAHAPEEESGWTQYLEDFSSEQRELEQSSYSNDDSFDSPSLISDAASPNTYNAAWNHNMSGNKDVLDCNAIGGAPPMFPKRLNVKKQKTKKYSCDDLEDTASSPVNSPKVSSYRRTDDNTGNFLKKDGGSDPNLAPGTDERSSINLDERKFDYTELKKKGLCLMPFSMLVNYLG